MITQTACKPEMQHLKVQHVSLVISLRITHKLTNWNQRLIVSILMHMYLTTAKMASVQMNGFVKDSQEVDSFEAC